MPAVQPVPPFPLTPGDWIHWFRYRLMRNDRERWSRDDLGRELGVSGRTVGRWETGRSLPTESDIENVSAALGLSLLQTEFLYRAFGPKRKERAPESHLLVSKVRDLMSAGFPVLVMDSLFYVRAWSTYNEVLGETGVMNQPVVDHVLWQILAEAAANPDDPAVQRRLNAWIKTVWIETAPMCGTAAYRRMISRLLLVPGFGEAWLSVVGLDQHDSLLDHEPAETVLPAGTFREFRTQFFFPPAYHVRQFVPMDAQAKASMAALQARGQPGLKFSRLLHWSEEDRFAAHLAGRPAHLRSIAADFENAEGNAAEVILFSKEFDCAPCAEARRFLEANRVAYVEKDVTLQDNLSLLVKQYHLLSVPVLVVRDRTIEGFDRAEYLKALGLRGTPA